MTSTGMIAAALAAACVAGCATSSVDIGPSYVSPILYQGLDCQQIALEAGRVASAASALAGQQDRQANKDSAAMAVSLLVFWPALFAVKGDDSTATELAQARGQMIALEQASAAKNCGIVFQTAPPAPPPEVARN